MTQWKIINIIADFFKDVKEPIWSIFIMLFVALFSIFTLHYNCEEEKLLLPPTSEARKENEWQNLSSFSHMQHTNFMWLLVFAVKSFSKKLFQNYHTMQKNVNSKETNALIL